MLNDVLRIYTVSGEKVIEITNVISRYDWDGKNKVGSDVAAGIYIWILEKESGEKYKGKFILVR